MAHNLYSDENGKTSFVAVGEKAWHGLGTYVEKAMTAAQAIELGGLDYLVEKKKITVAGGAIIPNYYATVRMDTKQPLGIVSPTYEVVQNHEAFEFFDSIIDRGEAIYQTAGVLGIGEKIFITAKLPEDIIVHGEHIENYLLLTAGHNGRASIKVGFTPVRVVCANTLASALIGLQKGVTIMHCKNAKQNLKDASRVMGMASKNVIALNDSFNQMARKKISDDKLRRYIEDVMMPKKETVSGEEFSKQFTEKVDRIFDFAKNHSTQLTDSTKGTVFGAYNAISGYYGWLKNYDSQEEKMKDICFKNASRRIEIAHHMAECLL